MNKLQIITERYKGELRSLTVAQWSELLQVPIKTLYGRRSRGKIGDDFIYGPYAKKRKKERQKMKELYLNQCYREFNFSQGAVNSWRQKNGIR